MPFLLDVNNDIFGFFYVTVVDYEINCINFFFISDRVACTVKVNMRIFLHRKPWFPGNTYVVNELQAENKRPIT